VLSRPDGLHLLGDPTEAALLVAALKAGLEPTALRRAWPRRREMPFDPGRRMMATVNDVPGGGQALFVKGAPGVVLDLSRRRQTPLGPAPLGEAERERVLESNRALAADGLRVLAIAWRAAGEATGSEDASDGDGDARARAAGQPGEPGSEEGDDIDVRDLTFLGLVAFVDPLKTGVREAIATCRQAGIRTFMLTGDQRATAEAIGRHLGLEPGTIRSRVSPEGKLALIEELQARGDIVAMTGDGVNDAPALARADIGIAMGRQGTDVAREAADVVLSDDNFATLVKAVEQGRVIYANLRKVIHFLFSCNLSEIFTIFAAIAVGLPSPLLPLQILWVNLVTDILPALGLIRDPAEPDVMRRPPRDPREGLVTWRFGGRVLAEGALLSAGALSAYLWVVWQAGPGPRATTMAFMALVLVHPFQAINCRSDRLSWWNLPPNALSWLALVGIIALQWMTVSMAPLAQLLGTVPLEGGDWLILAFGVLWPMGAMEVAKVWWRRRAMGRERPRPGAAAARTLSRMLRNH
jgi:Ca2+-transporting ATPase